MNIFFLNIRRPTSRGSGSGTQQGNGVSMPAGIADDQSKDFDFEKTEMKYDSTGMFHWSPARNLEDCILVIEFANHFHSFNKRNMWKKNKKKCVFFFSSQTQ